MIPTNYETNYFTLIGVFTRQSNCESIHPVSTNVSTFLTPIPDLDDLRFSQFSKAFKSNFNRYDSYVSKSA